MSGHEVWVPALAGASGLQPADVLVLGDASGNLGDETFVRVDAVAAARTLTLPPAAAGWWYVIQATAAGAGVLLDDQPGDTINGGAGPIAIAPVGTTTWLVWAQDGTNWNAYQIA